MPQIIEPPYKTMPTEGLPPLRWTVEQFVNLSTMGLLPDGKYELINGEIVGKMPISKAHMIVHSLLISLLIRLYGAEFLIPPVSLRASNDSLPEPDLCVSRVSIHEMEAAGFLQPQEAHIVVEIAVSTLGNDLTTKARLYAQAGITEYWVVDVNSRRLLVHEAPSEGEYATVTEYGESDTVIPQSASGRSFTVLEVLPAGLGDE